MRTNIPHLPSGTIVHGYKILTLLSTGDNFHLYKALSPNGQHVEIREFFLKDYSQRNSETFEIGYIDPDIELIQKLKADFDAQYANNANSEFQSNGTSYFVYDIHETPNIPVLRKSRVGGHSNKFNTPPKAFVHKKPDFSKRRSNSLLIPVIVLSILGVISFFVYQLFNLEQDFDTIAVKKIEEPIETIKETTKTEQPEPAPEPVIVQTDPEPEPEPVPEDTSYKPSPSLVSLKESIINSFINNRGKITPDMQSAYANYAETAVREYVTEQGGKFSSAFEEWLKKTKHNDVVFATFYPPDPSIATNADILVNALGERAYTYDQFLIAFAIGCRSQGLGAVSGGGSAIRPCDLFIAGKPPYNFFGSEPSSVDEKTYQHVHEYLTSKNLTPKQAWVDMKTTLAALGEYGVTRGNILSFLHEEMYRNDQMRRKRDPSPSAVEFMTYLIDKYEQIDKMRDVNQKRVSWDGVCLDLTPWPLMLPLVGGRPIRECEAVWDRYLGKMGGKRLWRYGPYRKDDAPEPPALFSLDPDPEWSLQSNDRQIYVGGVCGTMANLACTSRISLGSPAVFSSQPGHANLMYYTHGANGSLLHIGQSVDTTKATNGYWRLDDQRSNIVVPATYHIGLALSLNLKKDIFNSSRFALNIYKMAYDSKNNPNVPSNDFREPAFQSVLALNPFYTEVWFSLLKNRGNNIQAATQTINELRNAIPSGSRAGNLWKRPVYNKKFGRTGKNFRDGLSGLSKNYTDTVVASMLETALKNDALQFSSQEWSKLLTWMGNEAKNNNYAEVKQAYQTALVHSKGTKGIINTINRDFKTLVSYYSKRNPGKRKLKVNPDDLAIKINAVLLKFPDKDALPWVENFVKECPEKLRFKPKVGRSAEKTDLYNAVTNSYLKLADNDTARAFRDELKQQFDQFMLATYGDPSIED